MEQHLQTTRKITVAAFTVKSALRQVFWRVYMIKPVRSLSLYMMRASLNSAQRLGLLYRHSRAPGQPNDQYSIGIVTYIRRYEEFFEPLIGILCKLFPDTEIVVAVNGYYDQAQQEEYLRKVSSVLSVHPNVKTLLYRDAQSLAKLWNQLIINSLNRRLLILNDDIVLFPSFRKQFEQCGILASSIGLLKRSWSHFLISKEIVAKVGWFDERFPGVGNEDEDYEARLVLNNIAVPSFALRTLANVGVKTKDFSYGREMVVTNEKYTSDNRQFFNTKWELASDPKDGFVYVPILGKYARLRPGMQTPDFYPAISYSEVTR
jgi:hypothetical protein